MRKHTTLLWMGLFLLARAMGAQEPTQTAPAQSSTPKQETSAGSSSSSPKKKPLPGFLIIGTIFNENAMSFPGVEVHIRRTDEKKFRWTTTTNSRGEFAVRVPEGKEYEVTVRVKKYQDISRTVNSNNGDIQQRLSIQLAPVATEDKGAKK